MVGVLEGVRKSKSSQNLEDSNKNLRKSQSSTSLSRSKNKYRIWPLFLFLEQFFNLEKLLIVQYWAQLCFKLNTPYFDFSIYFSESAVKWETKDCGFTWARTRILSQGSKFLQEITIRIWIPDCQSVSELERAAISEAIDEHMLVVVGMFPFAEHLVFRWWWPSCTFGLAELWGEVPTRWLQPLLR
jgi:hypothetical protein